MARLRRVIHGVASSYILLAATSCYSLLAVPLALHYLDWNYFGLWTLMGSLVGYFSLVDGGMTSSASRLIIDYKDSREGGRYGGFLKTVFMVTLAQGLIVFLCGIALAGFLGSVLAIPSSLHTEFVHLLMLQCGISAVSFATRIFNLMLSGHQRMDLVNYAGTLGLAVNFVTLWMFFHLGFGVFSLAWSGLCNLMVIVIFQAIACLLLGYFPKQENWGRISWVQFIEIFYLGKDLFLVAVGTQLIMASQTVIITRMLGLPSAALWSVGLRVFNLLSQVIWRVLDNSGPVFAEMMARNEIARLRQRYQAIVILTASLSVFAAICFILCNSLFIPLWTHGKMQWPATNDILLAVWMILMSVSRCYGCFILLTKKVGFMHYVYFAEGAAFVLLSLLIARSGGLPAIIICSIFCAATFSSPYNLRRVSQYFDLPVKKISLDWFHPMGKLLFIFAPLAGLTWWILMPLPLLPRLVINMLVGLIIGGFLFMRFGLPSVFQEEIIARSPKFFNPILKRTLVTTPRS